MPGAKKVASSTSGIEIAPNIFLPRRALRFTYTTSRGPGGQNVNKVATRAQLRFDPRELEAHLGVAAIQRLMRLAGPSKVTIKGEILLVCDQNRSQRANRQTCLERLGKLIIEARKRPRTRRKTKPSKTSRRQRLDQKKRRSIVKQRRRKPADEA